MNRIALALALASTLSIAAAPAEAGPLRDAVKQAARKAVIGGLVIGSCIESRITGRPSFVCPR